MASSIVLTARARYPGQSESDVLFQFKKTTSPTGSPKFGDSMGEEHFFFFIEEILIEQFGGLLDYKLDFSNSAKLYSKLTNYVVLNRTS